MKNKKKKPKEKLIRRMVDDLKLEPVESSPAISILRHSDDDKTTLLGELQENLGDTGEFKRLLNIPVNSSHHSAETHVLNAPKAPPEESVKTMIASPSNPHPSAVSAAKNIPESSAESVTPKLVYGGGRAAGSPFENPFIQAESLKLAQQRILQLEREVESLRKDNEILSSANEISKQKNEDLITKVQTLEKQKHELKEVNESELEIFKDGLNAKESEIRRLKSKIEELENRLANDLRRIRVRERELENRLELSKSEKATLLRAKDEVILDLKRRIDLSQGEMEGYQNKVLEFQQALQLNQEQFARTVRALRIALTNLEVNDSTNTSITIAPYKKAE